MTKDQLRADFGNAVRRAREARGWSLRELARRCDVRPNSVSQWEGGRGAREDKVAQLEDVFGMERGQLGWMLGFSLPPSSVRVEAALQSDPTIPDDHKATLLAHLAEVRRIVEQRNAPQEGDRHDRQEPGGT